ncbi:putative ferric-chelate reductase 1 [Hippocampus comes]|uniref:putative ferric-chelate reductase 1 n=1 Tax=Hippocampus comes TaxID=109280 RepID=UPI00094EF0C5|nr:PREDICTED: putative ferric-chelate reductase 1 [Hippocampus comes]
MPNNCDPAGNNTSCLFVSLNADTPMSPNGFNLLVGLSGNSSGAIAFGLTQDFTMSVTQLFVCGMDSNGDFVFETVQRSSNGTLTPNERTTMQIQYRLVDTLIQCEFLVPNVNTSMMGEMMDGTTGVVVLGEAMVNNDTRRTENFTAILTSGRVNLTDVEGTVIVPRVLDISQNGCGNTKLCVRSPSECNPQAAGECLFTSLDTTDTSSGTFNILVELAGESDGYIGMGLTADASEGVTNLYICGRNGSDNSFLFRQLDRNNTDFSLTEVNREVVDILGAVSGTSIQCIFTIVGINAAATSRQAVTGTRNIILLGNGDINGAEIGDFNIVQNSGLLDITDAAANVNANPAVEAALNITRDGCGTTNLCLETPEDCDPLTDPMCHIVSSNATVSNTNVFNLTSRLSGYSTGYTALGLARNASQGTSSIFACGNNTDTGELFFRTFTRNNTDFSLTSNDRIVRDVFIEVTNKRIECQFTILNLNDVETRETNGTLADVLIANGTLNGGVLSPLNILLRQTVNLTSPTGTITIIVNGARATRSSDALLILLSLITLLAALRG